MSMCAGLEVNRPHILLGILIKQKIKRPHLAGPRNIYTVRPEFREKGAPMSIEAEVPAKRVCVVDSDTSVTAPASTKLQKKPVGVSCLPYRGIRDFLSPRPPRGANVACLPSEDPPKAKWHPQGSPALKFGNPLY